MTYLAPAGTPVTLHDIARGIACFAAPRQAGPALSASIRQISEAPRAWPVSSGRAAMTIILRAMRQSCPDGERNEVIVPAYTCYSVPAAIERAGLKPRLCDVDPETLGMDPDALERRVLDRTLAVVSASLYGMPDDLVAIEEICHKRNIFMLDDAAQALGATIAGRPAGSFGDAGLYSFDKGKVISTMQGGAIVARDGILVETLAKGMGNLPSCAVAEAAANFARLVAYSLLLRPGLYGLVRRLPFTGLGRTVYESRYPVTHLSLFQAGVAAILLERLEELNDARRQRARELAGAITGLPGVQPILPLAQAKPAYARFPFRVTAPGMRDKIIAALDHVGIGATASYPQSLADVPEVAARIPESDRQMPGAREVARTIVTLPTHAYCPPDLAIRVREILIACTG